MTRDFRLPQVMLLTVRNLTKSRRTPMLIFASLLQPVIWLVLFSQIFRRWRTRRSSKASATGPM